MHSRQFGWIIMGVALFVQVVLFRTLAPVNVQGPAWKCNTISPYVSNEGRGAIDFSALLSLVKPLIEKTDRGYQQDVYPPFTYAVFAPFALLPFHWAYFIHVLLLCAASIAAILILSSIIFRLRQFSGVSVTEKRCLEGFILVSLFAGYGFTFSVERGNYDAYSIFFCILFLKFLVERPRQVWLTGLFFTIAIHLKLYPLILLPLYFWRHSWKGAIPLGLLNLVFLFILGPGNAWDFLHAIREMMSTPLTWVGNHSSHYIAGALEKWVGVFQKRAWIRILTFLVVTPWAVLMARSILRGFGKLKPFVAEQAIVLFAVSLGLMCVLPSTSHDYKLVIAYPMVFIIMIWLYSGSEDASPRLNGILTVLWLFALVGLSKGVWVNYGLYPVDLLDHYKSALSDFVDNKFLYLFVLIQLAAYIGFRQGRSMNPPIPPKGLLPAG